MVHLNHHDAVTLLESVRQLHAGNDFDSFPHRAVAAVEALVGADVISYCEVDVIDNHLTRHLDPPHFPVYPWMVPTFDAYLHEHPLINYHRRTGDGHATRFSDVLPRRKLQRLGLYNEFFHKVGIEYQMSIALPPEPGTVIGIALNRAAADFSQHDRDLLNLLLPHLAQAYLGCRAATALHDNYDRLERAIQHVGRGVILIDDRRRILLCNDIASRAMERFFPDAVTGPNLRLPPRLDRWIASRLQELTSRSGPVARNHGAVVRDESRRLTIHLCPAVSSGEHLLLLDEQSATLSGHDLKTLGLPNRQADVLACIAQGLTNQEAARALGLSPRTVQKHLEHIFRKLGVESRSAAILRALEIAGSS